MMRRTGIVMPQQTIILAHEGHQGMVRAGAGCERESVVAAIGQTGGGNDTCMPSLPACGSQSKTKTFEVKQLPEGPWQEISVDILKISNGEHLLVVVDYYSSWLEAILLKKTDAQHVIKCMEAISTTPELPETVRSDNGPPFASKEFEFFFLEYLGISHKKGVPYLLQSNGEVERGNKTILNTVRIARLEGKDWTKAVQKFLFQYRVTPHTVTGVTPAELLM